MTDGKLDAPMTPKLDAKKWPLTALIDDYGIDRVQVKVACQWVVHGLGNRRSSLAEIAGIIREQIEHPEALLHKWRLDRSSTCSCDLCNKRVQL